MTTIEGQLRAAMRELGDQIPGGEPPALSLPACQAGFAGADQAPNDAGLFHAGLFDAGLPDADPRAAGRASQLRSQRARRRLAPVAAAASVLVIAVAAATIGALAHGRSDSPPQTGPTASSNSGQVPAYYVALRLIRGKVDQGVTAAVVTATATDAVLATVHVPAPWLTFTAVSAAADGTTFVLVAQKAWSDARSYPTPPPTKFYRLTIDPTAATRRMRAVLTPLPVPVQPSGQRFLGAALSPDGTKLAVETVAYGRLAKRAPLVQVFDLATGTERRWTPVAFIGGVTLGSGVYWEQDNRTLAVLGPSDVASRWLVLLVDTARSGRAAERVALRLSSSRTVIWRSVTITPDGRTLLVVKEYPASDGSPGGSERLERYDMRTGRLLSVLRHLKLGVPYQVLWSSPTGRTLIIIIRLRQVPSGQGVNTLDAAGVVTGQRFHPIPWSNYAYTGAW